MTRRKTPPLAPDARDDALAPLLANGWTMVDGRDAIRKEYRFRNFVEAFGWMTRAALHAERLDHHPEWSNVWNRVEVTLVTHDCDGLSDLDIRLAGRMDALATP